MKNKEYKIDKHFKRIMWDNIAQMCLSKDDDLKNEYFENGEIRKNWHKYCEENLKPGDLVTFDLPPKWVRSS